jgi:chromosomal replication initiator protein
MSKEEVWNIALGELETELSRANFTTWFKDTFILEDTEGTTVIGVPNSFAREWLENKYKDHILKALKKSLPKLENLEFKVATKKLFTEEPVELIDKELPEPRPISSEDGETLNHHHTFESFIVGDSNKLACAACESVAKTPGKSYNPLFLYGGVGLGKTHLMHAIGNEIMRRFPHKKIRYVPCEQFANEFIQMVRGGSIEKFKNKYRSIDALLIDDIQFLTGKERTQEEFFHTFNALHQKNKQIVISSDRPPKAIPLLEDRLCSRFEWGMIADISMPDFETRCAILISKAKEKNIKLDEDIIEYIARNIQHNIRELEGALNRLIAFSQIEGKEINKELTEKALSLVIDQRKREVDPDKIFDFICKFYEIQISDFLSKKRNREFAYPRQVAMYLLRHEFNFSFPKIAEKMKKKDHTTIMHGVEKIEKMLNTNEVLQKEISMIKEKIYVG